MLGRFPSEPDVRQPAIGRRRRIPRAAAIEGLTETTKGSLGGVILSDDCLVSLLPLADHCALIGEAYPLRLIRTQGVRLVADG